MQFQKRVKKQTMIEISSNALSILYPDGTSAVFDAAELSARIARSCNAAGAADAWIADDIALSVEFALQKHLQQSGRKSIPLAEIESCVVSILEDAGYAGAAEKFLSGGRPPGEMGKITQADVHTFLRSKLQLDPQEADAVAVKVISAMHAIRAERCSVRLILELARHFRETAAENRPAVRPVRPEKSSPPPAPEEIAARLPEFQRRYMDEGILTLRTGSRLFEAIRLDVDFHPLMKDLPFAPPVTELLLAPRLMECAEAADSVCRAAEECCGNPELPLIVTLLHAKEFVKTRMLCEEEDSVTRCARSLSDYFCSMLRKRPFKVFCR